MSTEEEEEEEQEDEYEISLKMCLNCIHFQFSSI